MKNQKNESRIEDFQVKGMTVGKTFGRSLVQQADPIPYAIIQCALSRTEVARRPRVGRSQGPAGAAGGQMAIPSEVLSSGLHWQYRREKCVRTRSRSCVSPISGKAFRKVLEGNSRMLKRNS